MIGSTSHIELDGVSYRLVGETEGHYDMVGEPLRPPNALTVQGDTPQKFQSRPDMLLWSWTDWSRGEGARILDAEETGRSWQLTAVRAFEQPGHLAPGFHVDITQDSSGTTDFALSVALVVAFGDLYGLDMNAATVYKWDVSNQRWGTSVALTGVTAGCSDNAVGDNTGIYWVERNTDNVWKWDGTSSPVKISDTLITAGNTVIAQLSDNVYVYRPESAIVWEIPKTGSGGTVIDSWTEAGEFAAGSTMLTSLDGFIYAVATQKTKTDIRRITPTTAAGVGFGFEFVSMIGLEGNDLWSHTGRLFLLGRDQADATTRTVMYLVPGGAYGTLGIVRQGDDMMTGTGAAARMLDHFWVQQRLSASSPNHALMQIDAVSGGIACVAYDAVGDATGIVPQGVVAFNGSIFWAVQQTAATKRVMRADPDRYTVSSSAISPEHDFGLVSDKYLGSLVLSCEPLLVDWTIYVDYQTNNDGSWINVIAYSTTDGVGTTGTATTDTLTVQFVSLQLRCRMVYTGSGIPTTAPVVLGIEARAGVAKKIRIFKYLLDLSDDHRGGKQSRGGASKVKSFAATVVKETAMDLKDGYTNRQAGEFDQYDVVVDTYRLILTRPGEGVGFVALREVV